jgi:heme exporter protein CcmB
VLRGIDLSLAPGSLTVLLGANAAGKTTLLRTLATLHRPASGQACVAGFDVLRSAAAVRQQVGWVAHAPLLFPDLTVAENLQLYARLYGVSAVGSRIGTLADALGLGRQLEQRVRTLSRGYQQRAAIARALLHEPQVLLLDEPYTGLDPAAADQLDRLLAEEATAGRTVLVTSHDLARARQVAGRVAVLSAGRLVWTGSPSELAEAELAELYRPPVAGSARVGVAAIDRRGPAEVPAAPLPPVTMPRRASWLAVVQAIVWKDLLVELRAREVVPPVVVFALVVLVLFHFTVASEPRLEAAVAPGALWVALVFGGMLGLARVTASDVDNGCQAGLAASPADRGGLFLGKWLAGLAFSLLVAALLVPAFVVFLNLPPGVLVPVAAVVVLGLLGWQAAGTLFGALAATARAREVLLPVLLLPALLPLVIAAVEATAGVLAGQPWSALAASLSIVASYAVIFLVLGVLLYPIIMESSS